MTGSSPVQKGEILAGKYRVEQVLGRGGMGVVVAARHVELDELVALKFLLPEAVAIPEAVSRFLKEARAAVRIKNEHVARVHDVGQLESGAPYIVMEYLRGSDLSALLNARGPLPLDEAIDFLLQACEAIADAHAVGIIHRDLKPANLMLVKRSDGSDCIKVLDFGISKVAAQAGAEASMNMTQTTAMLGSPAYMSPEQMMSARDVDGRTDIWALGMILYELLTAKLPFQAETLPALGVLIATRPHSPLRAFRPDLHPGVEGVVSRCLAKRREDRFSSVAELAQALGPFAPERSRISIERAVRIAGTAPGGSTSGPRQETYAAPGFSQSGNSTLIAEEGAGLGTSPNWGHTNNRPKSRRTATLAGGAAVVVVLAIAAFIATRGGSTASTASSASSPAVGVAAASAPQAAVLPAPPRAQPPAEPVRPAAEAALPLSAPSSAAETAAVDLRAAPAAAAPASPAGLPSRPAKAQPAAGHSPAVQGGPAPAAAPGKKSTYDDM